MAGSLRKATAASRLPAFLIGLRTSNEPCALSHDAIFSALPIETTRALMNRNSNPDAPRIISPEHRRNDPEPADGNSPLRQVLAALGGDAGPLACGAPANSNVLVGFLAGRRTGRRHLPCTLSYENLKVVSFAVSSRATMAI